MPTNRTRIRRPGRKGRITEEAVDLYIVCKKLGPIYLACIESDVCRSATENRHCPECRTYLDASRELTALLGFEPWHADVVDIDEPEPPPGTDDMRVKAWYRVWRAHCELEAAAAKRETAS